MSATLTDRYVHATVRAVPEDRREEIAAELRASIDDMVAARTDQGESQEGAERAVLTELGDPERLASRYSGARLQLIGPRYFLVYKRLTLQLLTWIPAVVAVIAVVVDLADDPSLGSAIGAAVSGAIQAAVQVVFWSTVAFAVLERVDVDAGLGEWSVDKLPQARLSAARQIPVADAVAALVFLVLLLGFLVVQQVSPLWRIKGERIALLDPDLWSSGWMWTLVASLVVGIGVEVAKLVRGRWTVGLAVGNTIATLLFAVPAVYLTAERAILNPELVQILDFQAEPYRLISIGVAVGLALTQVWEIGDTWYRTRQARRSGFEASPAVR